MLVKQARHRFTLFIWNHGTMSFPSSALVFYNAFDHLWPLLLPQFEPHPFQIQAIDHATICWYVQELGIMTEFIDILRCALPLRALNRHCSSRLWEWGIDCDELDCWATSVRMVRARLQPTILTIVIPSWLGIVLPLQNISEVVD